jgi:uncharacterized membrane protein YcaP (DUF421 family)
MVVLLKTLFLYGTFVVLFRCAGKRTLHEMTVFDLVLLLLIAEAAQVALIGDDPSLTHALVVIVTLVMIDVLLAFLKQRSHKVDRWLEGVPLVLVENGMPIAELMRRSAVDEDDILQAARERYGLERMDQIRLAVLERDGNISIIPRAR